MRILVLSFYFEPDLSAGSFRNTALVKALSRQLSTDDVIEVITTFPNRYYSYTARALEIEAKGNVTIKRIRLPSHQSGILDQTRAFLSYARGVFNLTNNKKTYDIIFASSSRLMTSVLAAYVARRSGAPLYLDVRDIFSDTVGDMYSRSLVRIALPLFRYLERFAIRSAAAVNVVSPAFVDYFRKIDSTKNYRVFTNGIDQMNWSHITQTCFEHDSKEILYAGNIGEGQGLDKIIPGAARKLGPTWSIRIIGDGGRCRLLKESSKGLDNVLMELPLARDDLIKRYQSADVLFLHLNNYPALNKVLPSKIFEYAATGKPILAGVGGFAAQFLKDNVENSATFSSGDVDGFLSALGELELKYTDRSKFIEYFSRTKIMNEMATDILSLAAGNKSHLPDSQRMFGKKLG